MHFADLHIHSTYSDGCFTPEEILKLAARKGIKYISITDHDTIESQHVLINYFSAENPAVIPGVEISTEYKGQEIHILGYFIDINNKELKDALCYVRSARINRVRDIVHELNKIGVIISPEDIEIEKFVSIGRPHIAKVLVDKGYSVNIKEAFQQFLAKGKPGYVDRYKIHFKEAIKLIKNSGGIAVLAHPGEIYKGLTLEKLIVDLRVYGLKGIEVFHPSHGIEEVSKFYNLARKYGLLITGGSDCHGNLVNDNMQMGSIGLNEILTNKLLVYKKYI